jgi:hypothetical protein
VERGMNDDVPDSVDIGTNSVSVGALSVSKSQHHGDAVKASEG